jgi:hypothetical protein
MVLRTLREISDLENCKSSGQAQDRGSETSISRFHDLESYVPADTRYSDSGTESIDPPRLSVNSVHTVPLVALIDACIN